MTNTRIAYLHGLGANNLGPKNQWLKSFFEVYDPQINYSSDKIYQTIKSDIIAFQPEVIIGSSMGGYFAYKLATELNINVILFNPALHSRSMEPDLFGYETEKFKPRIYVVFGKNDNVINPQKTIEILEKKGYSSKDFQVLDHAHDTPLEVFVKEISTQLNFKENK